MEAFKAFVFITLLPTALIAGPVRPNGAGSSSCSSTCTEASKFSYTVGKTYRYAYEATGVSSIPGASEQTSRVFVSANAHVHVISKCEMALTLSEVSFKTSDPDSSTLRDVGDYQYTSSLEENPLYFSFQDGRVEEVCPGAGDNKEILNFKRGVLSAFQNSMNQHQADQSMREIDVSGNCPTEYKVNQKGWKSTMITKSKTLLGCTDRQHYKTSLQSTPFHVPDAIQSLPLLKGDLKCSITLSKDGILSLASCVESLIFRPFSKKESGAKTETTQKLEFIDSRSTYGLMRVNIARRASLNFEHVINGNDQDQEIWALRDKMEQICKSSSNGVEKEVPGYFTEMVYLMKELQYNALNDIWSGIGTGLVSTDYKELAKDFFLDALPMVGTEHSVKVMVDRLLAEEVTGTQASIWLKSFAFLHHPNEGMIRDSFKRLLTSDSLRMDSLLPVTSAIHNYCLEQEDCQSVRAVTDVVDIFDSILGRDCSSSNDNLILTTLRAVGNLGFSDTLAPTIENCIEMSANSMSIRVTAVQAFRGMTCNAQRTSLMDVYVNKGEDSELRINAYLGLMMCPTSTVLERVKQTLESEEVNQVGSFVWTHLTNLAESSSPHKQELKEILQDEKLKNEFNMDQRKYSRNYEVSYFSDNFGTGATAESNLIWSSSSFLPRSGMLNLTVDVLGHSMNLLEVGGRTQGLQELLHEYIGDKLKDFNEDGKSKNPSRCVRQGKMDDMKQKHEVKEEDFTASMYLRMFGNELEYKHFTKEDIVALKNKFNAKEMMSSLAKGEDISFTHSAMFLDSTVSVPTIAGMALQLSVNGTATVQLKASGKMDLRRLSMKRMQIHFDLQPSAAIQIGGEMTLHAGIMKSGLKMATTLHSSTGFTGRLDLTNGQVLSVVADTPREKMEIFDIQSEFFIIHTNAVRPQKMLEDQAAIQQKGCSDKVWLKVLGYELCGDVSYVNATLMNDAPYFPLTGPLSGSLVLHKRDAPQGFKLLAENINTKDSSLGRLSIDTPGSQTDRNIAMNYFMDAKANSVEMEFASPWKKVLVKGSYSPGPKSYKMSGSVVVDQKTYELIMKLDKSETGRKVTWTPNLQIVRPKDSQLLARAPEKLGVTGSVSFTKNFDDVSADIDILTNLKPNPIKLQATYINRKSQKTLSGAVTLNKNEDYSATFEVMETYFARNSYPSRIRPTILISSPKWKIFLLSGTVDFKLDKQLKTNLQITMEKTLRSPIVFSMKGTKSKNRFKGNGKLSSQFGTIKSKGSIEVPLGGKSKKKGPLITAKITTTYNLPVIRDRMLRKNTVIFSSKIHDRSSNALMKYDANVIVESRNYQKASFVAGVSFSHKETFTKSVITYKGGAKSKNLRDKSKELRIETSLDHKIQKKDVVIKYDMTVLYPIKAIEWQLNGKHEHHLAKAISIETYNSFIYAKGKNSEFRLKIDDNSKKHMQYNGLLEFHYPDFQYMGEKIHGRAYRLISSLEQTTKKEYSHSLQVLVNKELEHTMYTKFKTLKNLDYELSSEISVGSQKDVQITLMNKYVKDKSESSLKVTKDGKVYRGETSSLLNMDQFINTLDVSWLDKKYQGSLDVSHKNQGEYKMEFSSLWDARKRIDAKSVFTLKETPKLSVIDLDVSLKTPFEGFEEFAFKRLAESSPKAIKEELKVVWQKPENQLSYKLWLLSPVTLARFQMDFEIITPFKELRMYRSEIRHKFASPNYLSTSVLSKYNENDVSSDILVSIRKDELQNKQEYKVQLNFIGAKRRALEMKIGDFADVSSFDPLTPHLPKKLAFKFNHDDNGMVYKSEVALYNDDNESKIDHQSTYTRVGKMVNLKSTIDVVLEDFMAHPFHIELTHANSLTNLNTTLSSRWGNAQRASLDVGISFLENDQSLYVHYSGTTKSVHDWIYKHRHSTINGWTGSSFSQVNKDVRFQSGSTYKVTKTELSYETFSSTAKMILKAEYETYPYTGYLKYSLLNPTNKNWQHMVVDGSVIKNNERDWTGDMRMVTPFEQAKNIDVKGNLKAIGKNVWSVDGGISYGIRKDIKIKASVDVDTFSKIEASLQSPWKDVELDITNKQRRKDVRTNIKVKYDKDKEIVAKSSWKNKLPAKSLFSLDLSTPFEEVRSANLKLMLQKIGKKWNGNFNMKSSNDKIKSLNLIFDNEVRDGFFDHNVEITSSAFDKVEARCMMEVHDQQNAFEVKLVAPEVGRNVLGFNTRSNSWVDFTQRWYGDIRGHNLDMGVGLKHEELETKAWLTFDYPGADKSFVTTSVHRIGNSLSDFDIGADLQIGKDTIPYKASVQFSYIQGKTAVGTTLTSPFTEPFSMLLKQEVTELGQTRTIYGKYDDSYMIDIYAMFEIYDAKYVDSSRLGYLFEGKGHTTGYSMETEWSDDGEEFNLESNYDKNVITVRGSHAPKHSNADNQDTVDVYVTTPFDKFKDLELHTSIEQTDTYTQSGTITLEYMDGEEAELTYDVKTRGKKVTANGLLLLPVDGYESNSINFVMVNNRNLFSVEAEGTAGQGENLKATVELKNKEDFTFNLVGPIKEFKNLKIAGKFNHKERRMNGDIQLQLSLHPRAISLEYDMHFKNEPRVMTFKLRSPYQDFKRADLTINCSGRSWKKLTTTTTLISEKLGRITLTTDLDYDSPASMEGKATLTSSLKNMENLRVSLKTNSDSENSLNSQLDLGWDVDKEIVNKVRWNRERGPITKLEIDLTTPFDDVKGLNIKMISTVDVSKKTTTFFAKHNDRIYLDTDLSSTLSGIHKFGLEMRKPRPMSVDVEGQLVDNTFDGKVFLNWNKHKPESQFEFNVHVADKSDESNIDTDFSFKVIHPVRIMAVKYLLRKASNEMQTSGLITWDESRGNTFSYDLGYTDRSSKYSDMYNAHIKVGVPQRSVKLLGSYGDSGTSRTMTGAALWDADRDEKKKVAMTTTHEYSDQMERLNVDLNLPSISKQLNVGVSLKRYYGTDILDSKTEISYSSDPRKTIHITNKIYNSVLDKSGDYNYTVETIFQHAITNTDLHWLSYLGQVNKMFTLGHKFTYQTIDLQQRVFALNFDTDNEKTGQLMITTPVKSISVVGERFNQRGQPSFKLELLEDSQKTLALSGKLLPRTQEFEMTIHYDRDDPTKSMFLTGAYITDKSVEMSLFDSDNVFIQMHVKLNTSHIIHNKINWKPSLPKDFQVFMGTKVTAFSYTTKEIWDAAVENVGKEVKAKYMRVSKELRDEIGQVFALMTKEMEIFNDQLEILRTQLRRIYNRNGLHIRDMGQQIDSALQELLGSIQDLVANYRSYYTAVSQATNEWINTLKNYPISLKYRQAIDDTVATLKEIRLALEEALKEVALELKGITNVAFQKYLELSRIVDRKLNSYIQSQNKLALFKQMKMEKERLTRMGANYEAKELESYDEFFLQTQQILEDQFDDLMTRQEFQQLHAMATEIYQQFKYWNEERGLSNALTRLLDMSKNLMLMELGKVKNVLMDIQKSKLTVYDPMRGELQFEIYMPFEMESFSKAPQFKIGQHAKDAYKWVENRLSPMRTTSLLDFYDGYAPSLTTSQWVPPFEATGYVIGSQTIMTFDKTTLDFMSTCSHVLVRDMLADSFSVVLNYDGNPVRNGIKSLCFSFGETLSMEVSKDYQLTVNGQETEMPYVNNLVRVVRDRDTITVTYINGLEVVMNPRIDLHKVTLSGWYHGRTAGLLGFYDNEQSNEASLIDRVYDFEVNRRPCNTRNVAVTPVPNDDIEGRCAELFQETSSQFVSCFKQVDPSVFLRMCQVYLSNIGEDLALRKVSQQYRSVCADNGIYMASLNYGVSQTCNVQESFETAQTADVVFVVADANCNQWASSSLAHIVTDMDRTLNKAGITDNRFGLVGYTDEDITVRTIHGNHFGNAKSFLKAVETLRFAQGDESGDIATAMRSVKDYPFRVAVPVKIVVVVPCSTCQVGILDRGLHNELKEQGFIVHALQEDIFTPEAYTPGRTYGVNNGQLLGKDVSQEQPMYTVVKDSSCNDMALATGGAVFDTIYLKQKNRRIQRDFIKTFTDHVRGGISYPECQQCECNLDSDSIECGLCGRSSLSDPALMAMVKVACLKTRSILRL